MAVTLFGDEVGEFEQFFGMSAEAFFQLGEVGVVHGDEVVETLPVAVFHAAAGEAARVDAVAAQHGFGFAVHVFAVVPAGSARAGGLDLGGQAAFGGGAAHDVFGHRRAADVAEADKQDKVAVTACMRKLLTILNARMRDYFAENGTIENGIQTA